MRVTDSYTAVIVIDNPYAFMKNLATTRTRKGGIDEVMMMRSKQVFIQSSSSSKSISSSNDSESLSIPHNVERYAGPFG